MPGVFEPYTGMPGATAERLAKHRVISQDGFLDYLPGGVVFDGAKTRDPGNPDYSTDGAAALRRLRAGLLVGKVTSGGKYANAVIGTTSGALTGTGTSVTLSVQQAVELVRRVGTSGTLKLTGPPTAAGVVRSVTVTYSAVDTATGVVTISAVGANEVQTLTFGAAATGGTMRLRVPLANGTMVTTDAITWNGTDATWLASINTALDAATGVAGGIVATGAAPDTAITFTFSGTGYAGLAQPAEMISVVTFPTSTTTATVVRTTTGVDGRFVTVSLVGDTDGSHTPISFLPGGWEVIVPSDSSDLPGPRLPISGKIDGSQLLPWPADASLKAWVRAALSPTPGLWVFTELF